MAKHKGEKKPKWTRPNPAKGKHGVKDKAAKKIGDKWDKKRNKNNE